MKTPKKRETGIYNIYNSGFDKNFTPKTGIYIYIYGGTRLYCRKLSIYRHLDQQFQSTVASRLFSIYRRKFSIYRRLSSRFSIYRKYRHKFSIYRRKIVNLPSQTNTFATVTVDWKCNCDGRLKNSRKCCDGRHGRSKLSGDTTVDWNCWGDGRSLPIERR